MRVAQRSIDMDVNCVLSTMGTIRADGEAASNDVTARSPLPGLNSWDIGYAELASWFHKSPTAGMNGLQLQDWKNCYESIHRFAASRDKIEQLRRSFPKDHAEGTGISGEQRHELYQETESFFFRSYKTISQVAALTTRWPTVFGQTPVGSMAKFIPWLEKRFSAYGYFSPLEDARRFRALVEHPEQHQAYEWTTVTVCGGPIHVVLFGPASRSGWIPLGSVAKPMEDGPGWDIAAPYENFVFNITAHALHACMWQIRQHLAGSVLTSPFRAIGIDSQGRQVDMSGLDMTKARGKMVSMGGGPVSVPGSSGPPGHDPVTHRGFSFGRPN
jgi:hypothetical protein